MRLPVHKGPTLLNNQLQLFKDNIVFRVDVGQRFSIGCDDDLVFTNYKRV